MELHHIDPYVQAQLYKLVSSGLCSGLAGQVMTALMVQPPKEGDESYEQFMAEEKAIFSSLVQRSKALVDGLNRIDGVCCEKAEGAMYAFPSVTVPEGTDHFLFGSYPSHWIWNRTYDNLFSFSVL